MCSIAVDRDNSYYSLSSDLCCCFLVGLCCDVDECVDPIGDLDGGSGVMMSRSSYLRNGPNCDVDVVDDGDDDDALL